MLFLFKSRIRGGHTHIEVYAGERTATFGCCGDLIMRNEEWNTFKETLAKLPPDAAEKIEFFDVSE